MSAAFRGVVWVPPFLVGLSAAVSAELAVGLLLYVTPGYLRHLTFLLAVLLGSFALGLWSRPTAKEERLTESIRRRWLLTLVAFAGGAFVAGAWSFQAGLAGSSLSSGIGLAFLAALPLYACGALLVSMAAERHPWSCPAPVGAAAAAGATLGTVLAGYVLVTLLVPASVYAMCLVALSGGALVHGWILSEEGERRSLVDVPSALGDVKAEEWSWGKKRHPERTLSENGRLRGAEVDGAPALPWETAALEILHADGPGFLILGGGSLTLARALSSRDPEPEIVVVERNATLLEVAVAHFAADKPLPNVQIVRDDPALSAAGGPGPFGGIVVDAVGVAPAGPVPLPGEDGFAALRSRLVDDGLLLFGGMDMDRAAGTPLEVLLADGGRVFPSVAVYRLVPPKQTPGPSAASGDLLVAFSPVFDKPFQRTAGRARLESVHHREGPEPEGGDQE